MKDLIKGHHPLMLFFVALVSLFFAFAVRNKIIGEGHTDLNANFFFFMVLASCIGIYFLIHEVIKEFTDFFCKKSLKKREIVPQPSLTTCVELKDVPSNESQDNAEPKNGNPPLTREDAKMLLQRYWQSKLTMQCVISRITQWITSSKTFLTYLM